MYRRNDASASRGEKLRERCSEEHAEGWCDRG